MVASLPGGEVTVNRLSWTATFSNPLYFIPEMKPILCSNENVSVMFVAKAYLLCVWTVPLK